jgi:lysophospholipase L1-like esterase
MATLAKIGAAFASLTLGGICTFPLSAAGQQREELPTSPTLPKRVYGMSGTPCVIRFDSVVYSPITGAILFNVEGAAGAQYNDYFLWHPKKKEDGKAVNMQIHSGANFGLLKELQIELIFSDQSTIAAQGNIRWLAIGDSLTVPAFYIEQTLQILKKDVPSVQVNAAGTKHPEGKEELKHEGRGGWTWKRYFQEFSSNPATSSPFVFKSDKGNNFDFSRYLREHHSGRPPEIITIFLGANDVYGTAAKFDRERMTESLNTAVAMVEKIRKDAPESAIGIIPPPPPSEQNGFGVNYQNGVTEWQYRRAMQYYIAGLLERFDGRWNERIYIVPGYLGFNAATAYPMASGRAQNALHPQADGFKPMSAALSAWMVHLLSSGAVRPQP